MISKWVALREQAGSLALRGPVRGSEFGGRQIDSRLSFGFRCDKEMKPNPFGFNLNFDEFLSVARVGGVGVAFRIVVDRGVDNLKSCFGLAFEKDATQFAIANGGGGAFGVLALPGVDSSE